MNKKISIGILLSLLFLFGLAYTPFAQTINSATMTLIDHDGNGFANIGDEVEVSVIVDGTVSGTSVRIFNNDLFEEAGQFTLNKETAGFGDGIEYAITLPIGSGATHDGADPLNVEFLIQTRLEGSTTDDLTDVTISGVSETIDNVPPAVSNSVFDDLGAGILVTGADFEISIDAADGSGIASVTADLRRLGLGETTAVPFDAGDTYLLDSEQIQEAQNQEQVSLNQNRSIIFTVTDEAGNVATRDSDDDGQDQDVDNVTPSAPVVVAVQRASNFDSSQDLFDIVITNGEDPLNEDNDPLLDEFGDEITFNSLMSGGQYNLYWNGGDGSTADDLLTSVPYNNNGVLEQQNTSFSEFAEGDFLLYRAVPVKNSGLRGEGDEDSVIIQRGIVEAEILAPEDGFLVGNSPSTELEVTAQMVAGLDGYELINSRVYVRDVPNPNTVEFIDMIAQPDGTLQPNFIVTANDFSGAGFSDEVTFVVRPQFRINGVQLRILTPAIAFQNNPVRTYNVDYQNPTVTLVSVDGDMGVSGFFDIEAEGETDFIYTITDNFEMDHDEASITARFLDDATSSEVLVIGPKTITGHVNDGFLSVDNDEFTFTYDVFTLPEFDGNPVFQIRVDDGRGNQTAYTGSAEFTLGDIPSSVPEITTTIASNVTPTSATLGGEVIDAGQLTVTERGIVWSVSPGPDVDNANKVEMGDDLGEFNSTVELLPFGTEIFYRAYAVNDEGTAYGGEESFETGNTLSLELTGVEGWRILSVPAAVSLEDFLAPIYTQGLTSGGNNTSGGTPNVYSWNLDSFGDEPDLGWEPITDLTNTTLNAGQGFLVYVYSDDNFDGNPEGFPKTLTVTGSEHPAPIMSPPLNTNNNGWTMMGNPFSAPMNWDELDHSGLDDTIYIWDPNSNDGDGGQPAGQSSGSWITRVGGTGDFDGMIHPFQGFFVTGDGSGTPDISFTQADKTTAGAGFYGKQVQDEAIVRLELNGEGMKNSAWLRFSPDGSMEPTIGEAWQLQPLSANYALLATRKGTDSLLDIGHFPISNSDLKIPLSVEATQSGRYTLSSTDFVLPLGFELYVTDLQEQISLPLDENFQYEFTIQQPAKIALNPILHFNSEPKKSTASAESRFVITTTALENNPYDLPETVNLLQNYPNPFNPATVISYQLPENSHVRLEVYDMLGKQVATLVDGQVNAGTHQVNFDASNLSSGVYMYRLHAGDTMITKQLTLIK